MGLSRPPFLYCCLFNTVDSTYICNIKFADDWMRTSDLWCWKRPTEPQVLPNVTLTSNWQLIVQQIIVFFRIAPVVKTRACDAAGRRTVSSQVAMACGRSCSISHHTFKLNCVTNPDPGSCLWSVEMCDTDLI